MGNGVVRVEVGGASITAGGTPDRRGRPYLIAGGASAGSGAPHVVQSIGKDVLFTNGERAVALDTRSGAMRSCRLDDGAPTDDEVASVWARASENTRRAACELGRSGSTRPAIDAIRLRNRLVVPEDSAAIPTTHRIVPLGLVPSRSAPPQAFDGWDTERTTTIWGTEGGVPSPQPGARVISRNGEKLVEFGLTPRTDGLFGATANRSELKDPTTPKLGDALQYVFELGFPREVARGATFVAAQWHQAPNMSPPLSVRFMERDGDRFVVIVVKPPDGGRTIRSEPIKLRRVGRHAFDTLVFDVKARWSPEDGALFAVVRRKYGGIVSELSYCGPSFRAGPYDYRGLRAGSIRLRFGAYARRYLVAGDVFGPTTAEGAAADLSAASRE
jgi:hypothetical protein